MIQNVDKSISMDLVETISEIGLSNNTPRELQDLFLHGQAIDTATLFNFGKYVQCTKWSVAVDLFSETILFSSFNEGNFKEVHFKECVL